MKIRNWMVNGYFEAKKQCPLINGLM